MADASDDDASSPSPRAASPLDDVAVTTSRELLARPKPYAEAGMSLEQFVDARGAKSLWGPTLRSMEIGRTATDPTVLEELAAILQNLPSRRNPNTVQHEQRLLATWALYFLDIKKGFGVDDLWNIDVIKTYATMYLAWRIESTTPRRRPSASRNDDGTKADVPSPNIKAVTLRSWFYVLIKCIGRYGVDPKKPENRSAGVSLLSDGLFGVLHDTCDRLIGFYKLNRKADVKPYWGRPEVDRIIYAALFLGRRDNRKPQIQLLVAVLMCFYTGLRISSLVGSHDRGREDLELIKIGDIKLFRENGLIHAEITAENFKSHGQGWNPMTKRFILRSVTKRHNIMFNFPSYLIAHLWNLGAFDTTIFPDIESIFQTELDQIPLLESMSELPLFRKALRGGREFDPSNDAPKQNSLGGSLRSTTLLAGMKRGCWHSLRRDAADEWSQYYTADVVSDALGHGCLMTTFLRNYSRGVTRLDMVGTRLEGELSADVDPAFASKVQAAHKARAADTRRLAVDAAVGDLKYIAERLDKDMEADEAISLARSRHKKVVLDDERVRILKDATESLANDVMDALQDILDLLDENDAELQMFRELADVPNRRQLNALLAVIRLNYDWLEDLDEFTTLWKSLEEAYEDWFKKDKTEKKGLRRDQRIEDVIGTVTSTTDATRKQAHADTTAEWGTLNKVLTEIHPRTGALKHKQLTGLEVDRSQGTQVFLTEEELPLGADLLAEACKSIDIMEKGADSVAGAVTMTGKRAQKGNASTGDDRFHDVREFNAIDEEEKADKIIDAITSHPVQELEQVLCAFLLQPILHREGFAAVSVDSDTLKCDLCTHYTHSEAAERVFRGSLDLKRHRLTHTLLRDLELVMRTDDPGVWFCPACYSTWDAYNRVKTHIETDCPYRPYFENLAKNTTIPARPRRGFIITQDELKARRLHFLSLSGVSAVVNQVADEFPDLVEHLANQAVEIQLPYEQE